MGSTVSARSNNKCNAAAAIVRHLVFVGKLERQCPLQDATYGMLCTLELARKKETTRKHTHMHVHTFLRAQSWQLRPLERATCCCFCWWWSTHHLDASTVLSQTDRRGDDDEANRRLRCAAHSLYAFPFVHCRQAPRTPAHTMFS